MRVPDEAVDALCVALLGAPWATFDEGLKNTLRQIHREGLEAAIPHLVCSCPHISEVDDYCPQHGRDA